MTQLDSRQHAAGLALLEDWITIWQSEMAALAMDREAHESMQRAADGWADQARAMLAAGADWLDAAGGFTGTDAPAGAAPAAAAPDGRDQLVRELLDRVDGLERRLAGVERG